MIAKYGQTERGISMIAKILFFIFIYIINNIYCSISSLSFNPDSYSSGLADSVFSEVGYVSCCGISEVYRPSVYLSRVEWVEGINFNFISFFRPFSFGNLSFALSYLDFGKIQGIDMYLNEYELPSSYETIFTVSYARNITTVVPAYRSWGSVGLNLKFIHSQLAKYSSEAIA
ncbi:MAG: hypothetical protein N2555_04655, partial [Endomicrobia bacterium]|nr:hypothetical protein [Endomicrobiia bacterium]